MPVPPPAPGRPPDPTGHPAWAGWIGPLRRRVARADQPDRARRAVVAAVAGQVAAADGWDPDDLGLRGSGQGPGVAVDAAPPDLLGPDLLGAVHEALVTAGDRRAGGVHYTPPALASALVAWAVSGWAPIDAPALGVVDLSVGGGAFLLAAARHQRARGRAVGSILDGLAGVDLDADAVAVAEVALRTWAHQEGWDGSGRGPTLVVGDGTAPEPFGPAGPVPGATDLVVGNPPFRGQLGRATARDAATAARLRAAWGEAVAGYVDDAAVFLRVACAWPRPGGRVVLVQPESVLATRDAGGVRAAVVDRADLVGLWVAGEPAFAAAVDVCAPVLQVRGPGRPPSRAAVARADGVAVRPGPPLPAPTGATWAPLLARRRGVPEVALGPGAGTMGDLVRATAGFRQHFYGLVPHLAEAPPEGERPGTAPVLTTGLVDPLALDWGLRPARIGGRTWSRPAVDLAAVEADAPEVGTWLRARLRPKVVVAPQTRVVEAAVDVAGRFVPGVPLVAVETRDEVAGPIPDDPGLLLWMVVAALSAPPVTAWAMEQAAGTARHRDALRLSTRQVVAVPLPVDREAWAQASRGLRDGRALVDVAPALTAAHGLDPDHPVVAWWRSRLPGHHLEPAPGPS